MNIEIIEGTYKIRGNDTSVAGLVFPLVEEFKMGASGGYVTVDGSAVNGFPDRNIKIRVSSSADYRAVGEDVKPTQRDESDEEIIERIRVRFDMLQDMTKAVKKGDVRAMIVSGPPGVGKSHIDENNIYAASMLDLNVIKSRSRREYRTEVLQNFIIRSILKSLGKNNIDEEIQKFDNKVKQNLETVHA